MSELREILNGIRDADYHDGGIRCLQLFAVDLIFFKQVRDDVCRLYSSNRPSDVRNKEHVTNWTRPYGEVFQFSLLNSSGHYDDTSTDHNQSCRGKSFREARQYPALASFISFFPHSINFRLTVMGPRSGLSAHEEHVTVRMRSGKVGLKARFHLPIITNPDAEVLLDGHVYHLPERVLCFFNNGCVHSATNGGSSARLHLIWDMLVTPEVLQLMFGECNTSDLPNIN